MSVEKWSRGVESKSETDFLDYVRKAWNDLKDYISSAFSVKVESKSNLGELRWNVNEHKDEENLKSGMETEGSLNWLKRIKRQFGYMV